MTDSHLPIPEGPPVVVTLQPHATVDGRSLARSLGQPPAWRPAQGCCGANRQGLMCRTRRGRWPAPRERWKSLSSYKRLARSDDPAPAANESPHRFSSGIIPVAASLSVKTYLDMTRVQATAAAERTWSVVLNSWSCLSPSCQRTPAGRWPFQAKMPRITNRSSA